MKGKRRAGVSVLAAVLVYLTGAVTGCGLFVSEQVKGPRELACKGLEYFRDEDYTDALETFTTLKERYPYSAYAILAELKVADAHFCREEYPEAIAAYDEFARLHPKNEVIPYVLYQIGESHYQQRLSMDRDQTSTLKAILSYERLLDEHPGSVYASEAKGKIDKCRELLANHELYVAHFYYKAEHYRAALARFESALADYTDALSTDREQEVRRLILTCREKLSEADEVDDSRYKEPTAAPRERMEFGTLRERD
jgi:outer membrane protein assembly factor BamD